MSDTPVLPLPPSYDWGLVVGRSISAVADTIGDWDRHPEARGSNGRVTFTPHTRYKKELSAPTAFVQFEVITAKIANGNIVDAQGEDGIYLISGAYKVSFTIDSGSIPGFDILVTPDHTLENPLDLVTAAPFVPEVGTPVTTVVIPAGAAEDQVIAWRNGRLVWVNGSVQAEAAAARAEAAATAAEDWAPSFVWNDTSLIIDGGTPVDLKGEKGDKGDTDWSASITALNSAMAARMLWSSAYAADANDLTTPGSYATNNATANIPVAASGFIDQHQLGSAYQQVWTRYGSSGEQWTRYFGGGAWAGWVRVDAASASFLRDQWLKVDPDTIAKTELGVWPVPTSQAWASLPFTGAGTLAQYPIQQNGSAVYQSAIPSSDLTKEWRRYGGSSWGPWVPVHVEAEVDIPSGSGFKLVPLALTVGPSYAGAVPTDGAARFPLRYSAPITRWRLHIEARDPRTGWIATTDSTITGVWIGADNGTDSGITMGAPTAVSGSAVIPAGQEWVSKWSDTPISGDMLLSIGYTASERGLVGGAWISTTPSDAFSTEGTWTKGARAPFSVWIEAETYATTPVVAVVGDSISVGVGAALPINDSTLSQWARDFGALPVHYAQSGDSMGASGASSQWKWQRWQHLSRPDACVMALGTNDLLTAGTSVEESQRLHGVVLEHIRNLISTTVFDATVLPSTAFTGAPEDNRRAYNTWLGAQRDGSRGVYWFGPAVSTDDETIPASLTPDGTHLNTEGYALLAGVLTDGAPLTAPAPVYA